MTQNRKYIGIDYGVKKIAMAVLSPDGEGAVPGVFSCFWSKKHDADEVLTYIAPTIYQHENQFNDVNRVAIEYPFMARNAKTSVRMSMVAGVIYSTVSVIAPHADIVFVPPTAWKREVVGYAHSDKDQTMQKMEERFPTVDLNNDDESDALAMACWAWKTDVDVE